MSLEIFMRNILCALGSHKTFACEIFAIFIVAPGYGLRSAGVIE